MKFTKFLTLKFSIMITLITLVLTLAVVLISGLIAILSGGAGLSDYICSLSCSFFMLQVGLTYDRKDDMAGGVWTTVITLGFMSLWWFTTYSILGTWVDHMDNSRFGSLVTSTVLILALGMFFLGQQIRKSRSYSDFLWKDSYGIF